MAERERTSNPTGSTQFTLLTQFPCNATTGTHSTPTTKDVYFAARVSNDAKARPAPKSREESGPRKSEGGRRSVPGTCVGGTLVREGRKG